MSQTQAESQEIPNPPSRFSKIHRESFSQVEIFRKILADNRKAKTATLPMPRFDCFMKFYVFLISIARKILRRDDSLKQIRDLNFNNDRSTESHKRIIRFFRLLLNLKKCVKIMRFRTKFRSLAYLTKKEISIINDWTHVEELDKRKTFAFFLIRSKTLRKLMISAMKCAKKVVEGQLKFIVRIFSKSFIFLNPVNFFRSY